MWRKNGNVKNENGFTLIETLVAMVILAVALLAIAQMQISAMQGNRSSYDTTEASAIASDVIEQLVLQNWSDPNAVACPPNDSVVRSNITYTRTCQLVGATVGQRSATVTVTWHGQNRPRVLQVDSLL
jgi:prepilin-type N-terminal cleavage/methylation domain-containing protein